MAKMDLTAADSSKHGRPNDPKPKGPGFRDLFTPKLVTVLREGYGLHHLRADAPGAIVP